jgi:hypothetical protein
MVVLCLAATVGLAGVCDVKTAHNVERGVG